MTAQCLKCLQLLAARQMRLIDHMVFFNMLQLEIENQLQRSKQKFFVNRKISQIADCDRSPSQKRLSILQFMFW